MINISFLLIIYKFYNKNNIINYFLSINISFHFDNFIIIILYLNFIFKLIIIFIIILIEYFINIKKAELIIKKNIRMKLILRKIIRK